MNKPVIVFLLGFVLFWGTIIGYVITLHHSVKVKEQEITRLTKIIEDTVARHNVKNHQLNQALEKVDALSGANEALIEHCRPCDVTRAIQATPLPPMKKVRT